MDHFDNLNGKSPLTAIVQRLPLPEEELLVLKVTRVAADLYDSPQQGQGLLDLVSEFSLAPERQPSLGNSTEY